MPIYFVWFITALLSVGGDANDQNLPQSGRLLYCVRSGFINSNRTGFGKTLQLAEDFPSSSTITRDSVNMPMI
jgi:hypothetical protein